jgi:hypothetical protein
MYKPEFTTDGRSHPEWFSTSPFFSPAVRGRNGTDSIADVRNTFQFVSEERSQETNVLAEIAQPPMSCSRRALRKRDFPIIAA